jgi:hypothetical protein
VKKLIILLAISVITLSTASFSYDSRDQHYRYKTDMDRWENCWGDIGIVFEDGRLTFSYDHDEYETVEITEAGELYVNGDEIELSDHETRLVTDYFHLMLEFHMKAWEMGLEAGKIGAKSGALAAHAVASAFQMIDYDGKDRTEVKESLKRHSEKLKAESLALKKQGKELRELNDKLEDLHLELRDEIDALDDLEWFEFPE